VADQRGSQTNAEGLAAAVLAIGGRVAQGWRDSFGGFFRAAGAGDTTWYEFAEAIFADAARFNRPSPTLVPIATADWPTAARRPANSQLNCDKLANIFGVRLPPWRPSLDRAISEMCRTA
jgi:dTDP-4-dehydrorhamnose reductase